MAMTTNRIINGIGHVFLDNEIDAFSGGEVARQIMDFKANGLHVVVNINSPGGSVLAGFQIMDAIIQTNADTHISGMAASMAGIIALFGHNVTANDFSILMIHKPQGNNDDLLKIITERLKKILLVKSSLHEDEVESMLSDGKDHFFDAQEAFEKGLLTSEPIDTGKRVPVETQLLNIQEQFLVYNKITEQIDQTEMKDVINRLQLNGNATETDILNKIGEIEKEASDALELATEAEAEKVEMKAKLDETQDLLDKANVGAAKTLVKSFVDAGTIKKDDAGGWEKLATNDFTQAESLLSAIVVDHSTHVAHSGPSNNGNTEEDVINDAGKLEAFMRNESQVKALQESDPKKLEQYQEKYITNLEIK